MYKGANHHQSIQVKCTMNEPIQLLADKLSSKSSELYIFWQNYDQLYRQYNEKANQNNKLREQVQYLRKTSHQPKQAEIRIQQDPYLKQRLKTSQQSCQSLRNQIEKYKSYNRDLKLDATKLTQEINQMQILITQLRDQNSQQRISIANILQKLKGAQNELKQYQKISELVREKDMIIEKLTEKHRQFQSLLEQRDDQIEKLSKQFKDSRNKYERIMKETMQNAKETVMNSLPNNYRISHQKLRVTQY